MCGASSQQNQIEQAQSNFYQTLTSEYQAVFGESQGITKMLTQVFEPLFQAGPSQTGFAPGETQALDSSATTGVGTNYANAEKALAVQQGSEGGGNSFIPAGAKEQQKEQLAQSASQQQSSEQLQIQEANYQQGYQNWLNAAAGLGNVNAQLNPTGLAGATTGAGSAASTTANEIAQENNSWLQLVSGAIGATGQAFQGAGKNLGG